VLFRDRLAGALARSRRHRTGLLVLFAALDGFKEVNDSLGHHAGDELLVGVAGWLTSVLRSSDSLARLGGDEFLMLLEGVDGDQEMGRAVARVRDAIMNSTFVIDGHRLALDVTIGVVCADESHASAEDLIRDADAAMYQAKQLGRGGYAVFDRVMREHAADDLRVEDELRAALGAGQLRLLYQPIVSLDDGRISSWRRCCAGSIPSEACSAVGFPGCGRRERPDRADRHVGARSGLPSRSGVAGVDAEPVHRRHQHQHGRERACAARAQQDS